MSELVVENGALRRQPEESPKDSDAELATLIDEAHSQLQSAQTLERWVRRTLIAAGTIAAIYIPLQAWVSVDSSEPTDTGHPHAWEHEAHEHPVHITHVYPDPIPPTQPPSRCEGCDGGGGTRSTTQQNITVATPVLRITTAKQNPFWHTAKFVNDGDEFWALPDADFKMRLQGNARGCSQPSCFQFQAVLLESGSTFSINVRGERLSASARCREVAMPLAPELHCDLPGVTGVRQCLRMRFSETPVAADEAKLALDIRWLEGSC